MGLQSMPANCQDTTMSTRACVSLLTAFSISCLAHAQSVINITDDVTRLSAIAPNRAVEVVLDSRLAKSADEFPDAAAGEFPDRFRVVRSLKIKVNGHEIFIPHSAYADLAWVATAELKFGKSRNLLVITGGDASESYSAKIEFDGKAIRSRRLYSNLDHGGPTERTQYSLRDLN